MRRTRRCSWSGCLGGVSAGLSGPRPPPASRARRRRRRHPFTPSLRLRRDRGWTSPRHRRVRVWSRGAASAATSRATLTCAALPRTRRPSAVCCLLPSELSGRMAHVTRAASLCPLARLMFRRRLTVCTFLLPVLAARRHPEGCLPVEVPRHRRWRRHSDDGRHKLPQHSHLEGQRGVVAPGHGRAVVRSLECPAVLHSGDGGDPHHLPAGRA